MNNKGQLLIEIAFTLMLLAIVLGVLIYFLNVYSRAQKYQTFNQGIAIAGFERYRNVLISLAQTDWQILDSLTPAQDYRLILGNTGWQIATGVETISIGNESYNFKFRISDYQTRTIKFVTVTAKYSNLIFEDYFLLPKLNVSY